MEDFIFLFTEFETAKTMPLVEFLVEHIYRKIWGFSYL